MYHNADYLEISTQFRYNKGQGYFRGNLFKAGPNTSGTNHREVASTLKSMI